MVRAVGAVVAVNARGDMGLPFVPFLAEPPHLFVGASLDVLGLKGGVFCGMPFLNDFRSSRRKGFAEKGRAIRLNSATCHCTVRTAARASSLPHAGLPFMPALRAEPPNLFARAWRHTRRRQVAILSRVPFSSKSRIGACQIIKARHKNRSIFRSRCRRRIGGFRSSFIPLVMAKRTGALFSVYALLYRLVPFTPAIGAEPPHVFLRIWPGVI